MTGAWAWSITKNVATKAATFFVMLHEMDRKVSGDSFFQIFEERPERILGNSLSNRIIGDGNSAAQFGIRIIGKRRTIGLVVQADLANSIDRAASAFALHLKDEEIRSLAIGNIDNDAIGPF